MIEVDLSLTPTLKWVLHDSIKSTDNVKVVIITDLRQRQNSASNAENTTDIPKTLQRPSWCCFLVI